MVILLTCLFVSYACTDLIIGRGNHVEVHQSKYSDTATFFADAGSSIGEASAVRKSTRSRACA